VFYIDIFPSQYNINVHSGNASHCSVSFCIFQAHIYLSNPTACEVATMGRRLTFLFLLSMLTVGLSGAAASPHQYLQSTLGYSSLASATSPTLVLTVPSTPQSPDHIIDVQVSISGGSNLAAFEFALEYDRSLVHVTGMTPGNFLGTSASCVPNTTRCTVVLGPIDQNGRTSVGAYSYGTGPGATGDGVLAVLHLQPTGATGSALLHIVDALVVDVGATPLTPATQDATLVLAAPTASPTPTEPPVYKRYLPLIRR
jgi:hypothetical protein